MASMTTRDDALQFGAVDWQRLIREGAVADQHAAAIKGAEASSLEAVLGDAAAARAYAAALAAVAGGVDDGAARRYCVTKAEDVLVADGAAAAKAQLEEERIKRDKLLRALQQAYQLSAAVVSRSREPLSVQARSLSRRRPRLCRWDALPLEASRSPRCSSSAPGCCTAGPRRPSSPSAHL